MAGTTQAWWTLLCAVAVANVAAWCGTAWALRRSGLSWRADRVAHAQLLLSAGYVAGCAYRSFVPVFDVPRLCLIDSGLSAVIVGRSVATVAELCFAAQWAILLGAFARSASSARLRALAFALVPAIALAEVCSWLSVLTTANLGHVIEESIWGVSAALTALALVGLAPRIERRQRTLALAVATVAAGYAAYMAFVDVPMYWTRWVADEAAGRVYLDVSSGVVDAATRWAVSLRWEDWRGEAPWMTAYFSAAVWCSIALVHASRLWQQPRPDAPARLASA